MKIYLISPPKLTKSFNSKIFDTITDIIPVEYFQFRPKFKLLKDRLNFVEIHYESFSRVCKKKKIKLIINDDFEIAEEFTFDGIHLGQNDKSCKAAKEKFGKEFIVGVSCSSSENFYKKAKNDGADYVAFGPAFNSKTKKGLSIDLGDLKKFIKKIELPFVLIGGVNHKNIKNLFHLEPNYIAIIDSLWNFKEGSQNSAYQFKKILRDKSYENDS